MNIIKWVANVVIMLSSRCPKFLPHKILLLFVFDAHKIIWKEKLQTFMVNYVHFRISAAESTSQVSSNGYTQPRTCKKLKTQVSSKNLPLVSKYNWILDFCLRYMGGVDKHDRILTYYPGSESYEVV